MSATYPPFHRVIEDLAITIAEGRNRDAITMLRGEWPGFVPTDAVLKAMVESRPPLADGHLAGLTGYVKQQGAGHG